MKGPRILQERHKQKQTTLLSLKEKRKAQTAQLSTQRNGMVARSETKEIQRSGKVQVCSGEIQLEQHHPLQLGVAARLTHNPGTVLPGRTQTRKLLACTCICHQNVCGTWCPAVCRPTSDHVKNIRSISRMLIRVEAPHQTVILRTHTHRGSHHHDLICNQQPAYFFFSLSMYTRYVAQEDSSSISSSSSYSGAEVGR